MKQPELVHFQITRGCNLRCWFCGQWGREGFFSDAKGAEMTLEEWKRVAAPLNPACTGVILWGGEPLTSPFFAELAEHLSTRGFPLGLVTNGTLIHRHADLIREKFKTVYVSLDGTREIHDAIRGDGVFDAVCGNLRGLNNVVINTVVSTELVPVIADFMKLLEQFKPREVLLQQMIPYTSDGGAPDLRRLQLPATPFPARVIPHGDAGTPCRSPFRHAHVTWNGEVMFCTDFYDFSAGNARNGGILEIWQNEEAERFRRRVISGENPNCAHCSWRSCETFEV
ncbi:MAG: radical SAM protein [Clostridiales bacterium]|nr:radical SAM protein [Clostridiales bacterium]